MADPTLHSRCHAVARHCSRGVVLVIALVLLVVIGISSVLAIRTVTFGDLISHNMGSQDSAMRAAETALRYCEEQARLVASGASPAGFQIQPVVNAGDAIAWKVLDAWKTKANEVPQSVMGTQIAFPTLPQCLVEEVEMGAAPGGSGAALPERSFQVTARGFSPDHERTNGASKSGAEVWLQSVLRLF